MDGNRLLRNRRKSRLVVEGKAANHVVASFAPRQVNAVVVGKKRNRLFVEVEAHVVGSALGFEKHDLEVGSHWDYIEVFEMLSYRVVVVG